MKVVKRVNQASRYHRIAQAAVARFLAGDPDPETLHRLRTHLRRLQAYAALMGQDSRAAQIGATVSRLSRLRTLQVFERYLARHQASRTDRKIVSKQIGHVRAKLQRDDLAADLRGCLDPSLLKPVPVPPEWMAGHLDAVRQDHAKALHELVAVASIKPRRKVLHAIRLRLKSIRYQEEWASTQPYDRPELIDRITPPLSLLGRYEELAEFRKLAQKLELKSTGKIIKAWRRARKRARAVPRDLMPVIQRLASAPESPYLRQAHQR